jgi:AcrR family transcriptional regulator
MRIGKRRYIDETIEVTAERGLENVTVRRIAGKAGVSEAALYRHFEGKDDLVNESFLTIDKEVSELFLESFYANSYTGKDFEETLRLVWNDVFSFMLKEKSKTLFLIRYRFSSLFTDEVRKKRLINSERFTPVCRALAEKLGGSEEYYRNYAISYIFEVTILFSEKILLGRLAYSKELEDSLWQFLLNIIKNFSEDVVLNG